MPITVKPGERVSVLIVDDEADIREMLKEFLHSMDCFDFIVEAEDGHRAITKAQNQKFDLIISDFKMPKMDGLSFVKHLRSSKDDKNLRTPFLFLSGNFTKDTIAKALEKEVRYFIAKPFNGEAFVQKVEEILLKERREKVRPIPLKAAQ
ncbi:MAG: response regulator [Halobacteriovoraceae bacterium]|nr:response regulator [Halobacteriovoraceae bacterium]|tara:strand:+ start:2823 stop:3272 length:450 start_codon:yes stop_codon:yes gene_type:complete